MSQLSERILERRIERMRLGQKAGSIEKLLSDPDVEVALVPLTEAEFELAMMKSASIFDQFPGPAGVEMADRELQSNTLLHALRSPDNLEEKIFNSIEELKDTLGHADIANLGECYAMMIDNSSPSIENISQEQLDEIKKVLMEIDWNVLSGKQWWLLKRFLSSLMPMLLTDKLRGFLQTNS